MYGKREWVSLFGCKNILNTVQDELLAVGTLKKKDEKSRKDFQRLLYQIRKESSLCPGHNSNQQIRKDRTVISWYY